MTFSQNSNILIFKALLHCLNKANFKLSVSCKDLSKGRAFLLSLVTVTISDEDISNILQLLFLIFLFNSKLVCSLDFFLFLCVNVIFNLINMMA